MRTICLFLAAISVAGCNVYDILTVPPPSEGVSVPIKSDLFLAVAGKINDHPVDILLDTGTILFNLVPPSAVERLGLKPSGENPYAGTDEDGVGVCGAIGANSTLSEMLYTADRLDIGGVIVENVAFVVLEEEGFNTFEAAKFDCILNGAMLSQLDWRIDHGGALLTMYPLNSMSRAADPADLTVIGGDLPLFIQLQNAPRPGGFSTPVRFGDDNPDTIDTLIDTGGGIEFAIGERLVEQTGWDVRALPHIESSLFAAGGNCTTLRFRAPKISVGPRAYEGVHSVTLPSSPIGLIGWRFFANHESVRVSPGGRWIAFDKGESTDANFALPVMSFGVEVALSSDGSYRVVKVTAGSDAEMEGVVKGDKLVAVNGVSVSTLEGNSLLFGPDTMRAGVAVYTFENQQGERRDVELTAVPLL